MASFKKFKVRVLKNINFPVLQGVRTTKNKIIKANTILYAVTIPDGTWNVSESEMTSSIIPFGITVYKDMTHPAISSADPKYVFTVKDFAIVND